jgi:hypothetical protein
MEAALAALPMAQWRMDSVEQNSPLVTSPKTSQPNNAGEAVAVHRNRNDLPNRREATPAPGLTLEILKQGCDELQRSTQPLLLHAPNLGFFKRSTLR